MRYVRALLALLVVSFATPAAAQCSFTPQPDSTRPPLTGRMVYEDEIGGEIYAFDFLFANSSTVPSLIPTASWGLSAPVNPVFSPDGQGIVFSAVETIGGVAQRHIYYWIIGSGSPVNLTLSMGNLRNEDVKFSADGKHMVWKQNFGISVADFWFDDQGVPAIFNVRHVVSGTQNAASEASGPVLSPDDNFIYYFTGGPMAPPLRLQRYDMTAASSALAFTQRTAIGYYYPADPDLYELIYVSALNATVTQDKIFTYPSVEFASTTDVGLPWNATDCAADNSDPAPVSEDFFVYSRHDSMTGIDPNYNLYIGQMSSGLAWKLSPLNVNISGGKMVGANYTSIRPLQ